MNTSHTPPTHFVPRRRAGLRAVAAGIAMSVVLGGCRDAPTDPLVGLVAEEAGGALAMGVRLPDPSFWSDSVVDGEGARALEAWQRSWDLPLPEARVLREKSYPALVRGLVDVASIEVLAQETAALGEGVRRGLALDAGQLPAHVSTGLVEAAAQHATALVAQARGDTETLLAALVRGGDALREVGPEAVARDLVAGVETSIRRLSPDDTYTEQDLERLRRLILGGRQAVEDGDWVLAIRRAYYAKGLLSGNGRDPS